MTADTLELILLLLASAVLVVGVFRYFNLPAVIGYLLVGALLGPRGLQLVPDTDATRHVGEFGVVFLMFSIGLEFSLPRLYAMKRLVFGLGGAQVGLSMLVFTLLGTLFGLSGFAAFALGGALAMSSTALLSKLLADRLELDAEHGRRVIGVLLFQDLAVVPLLILIPALGQSAGELASSLAFAGLKAALVLSLVLVFGQRLMRSWFTVVARRRSAELFMLNVLLITLGLAWVTEQAGLSLALGAFLAGMLISETEYRFQVEEDIKPFRDVLLGLFLVTVGMFLDLRLIGANLLAVLGLVATLLLLKAAIVFGSARAFGSPAGTAVRTGLWLCAGGEFGFVLLAQAGDTGLLPPQVLQVTVAALVLSILLAPFVVQISDRVVMRFVASEWLLRSMELTRVAAQSIGTERHVIICGYGRSGQYLARFLEQAEVGYVALDLDPDRVREAAAAGETVVYGDAARRETLVAAGLLRASALVISFVDSKTALRVINHVQALRPGLPTVVRVLDEAEMDEMVRSGATEVVPDVLEASIMLASHTMALVGVPLSQVIRRVRDIRNQRYALMRGFFHGASDAADRPESQQERLHSLVLAPGAWAIGRSLADLRLGELGVRVSAIRRRGIRAVDPTAETRFVAGDVLVLLGVPADLAVAELRVLKGG